MKLTIYRGSKEIGGTLIELKTSSTRLLIDAGYPLFLNGSPIEDTIAKLPSVKLLELGVLPKISGLYTWDEPAFDAVVISHAHIDHYGLLKYIHPCIPVYLSAGTQKIVELSQTFRIVDKFPINACTFKMYEPFSVGNIRIKPYLMDHSAFDAAAFEFSAEGKTMLYSGDFRGHGRKAVCLERFIQNAQKQADVLLTEGTMLGRADETVLTENEVEQAVAEAATGINAPVLFQCSSQNIDRLVSFYRAALRLGKLFVVDVYTANVLFELRSLGNHLPYPSGEYPNIRVFFPFRLTQKIFEKIGQEYARRFSAFHISKEELTIKGKTILMTARPSIWRDIEKCELRDGLFLYSMWNGYRDTEYQKKFEASLLDAGFICKAIHTSGHASVPDIQRLMTELNPKRIVPIHTMIPSAFMNISDKVILQEDGKKLEI